MAELRELEEEAARLGSGIEESAAGKRQLLAGAPALAASCTPTGVACAAGAWGGLGELADREGERPPPRSPPYLPPRS
jgi:hypothetical protein